jgi:hypothetical protein
MFGWAIERDILPTSPVVNVKALGKSGDPVVRYAGRSRPWTETQCRRARCRSCKKASPRKFRIELRIEPCNGWRVAQVPDARQRRSWSAGEHSNMPITPILRHSPAPFDPLAYGLRARARHMQHFFYLRFGGSLVSVPIMIERGTMP